MNTIHQKDLVRAIAMCKPLMNTCVARVSPGSGGMSSWSRPCASNSALIGIVALLKTQEESSGAGRIKFAVRSCSPRRSWWRLSSVPSSCITRDLVMHHT